MNSYGATACPTCGCINKMYRMLANIKELPKWDNVKCYGCGFKYKHSDKFNNLKTEYEKIKQEGRD